MQLRMVPSGAYYGKAGCWRGLEMATPRLRGLLELRENCIGMAVG